MSGIVQGLVGGTGASEIKKAKPVNFSTGGHTGKFDKKSRTFNLTRSSGMNTAISNLSQGLQNRSLAFRQLKEQVAPGFGDLTQARVRAIRDAGERTVGSLKNRLRQRRVLGSSFAGNQIASVEGQFAQEEERARAEAKVQELALSSEFTNQETAAAIQASQVLIDQFNLEAGMAASFASNTQNMLSQNAIAAAQVQSAASAGAAELLGVGLGLLDFE